MCGGGDGIWGGLVMRLLCCGGFGAVEVEELGFYRWRKKDERGIGFG